jgi:hypothetical protein
MLKAFFAVVSICFLFSSAYAQAKEESLLKVEYCISHAKETPGQEFAIYFYGDSTKNPTNNLNKPSTFINHSDIAMSMKSVTDRTQFVKHLVTAVVVRSGKRENGKFIADPSRQDPDPYWNN